MSKHIPEPLRVRSAQGAYEVTFAADVQEVVTALSEIPKGLVVVDRRAFELHQEALDPLRKAFPLDAIDSTEDLKTLGGVERIAHWLHKHRCGRHSRLIVIGGGVIQDAACFAAHVYHRGIAWIYVPTTLLAMADSCIGAKASINLGALKNQLGAFHAPAAVLICGQFTETLSDVDVISGFGEILKLHVIGSEAHLRSLESAVEAGGLRTDRLPELIQVSLDVKRGLVEEDEYDSGRRQILNYGHTFGHALEAVTEHAVPHGIAVAWGMDVVNHLASIRGELAPSTRNRIRSFIRRFLAYRRPSGVTANALLDAARSDKKVRDGLLRLVLLRSPGTLEIVPVKIGSALENALDGYLNSYDVYAAVAP